MGAAEIQPMIAKTFNGATVEKVVIDDEFGCVTATVNGMKNVDCGNVEDYAFGGQFYHPA